MKSARQTVGLVTLGALLLLALGARGQSLLFGTMPVVNGTSNSTAIAVSTSVYPLGTFRIENGGLTNVNEVVGYIQLSIDRTNYVTIGTYRPLATNAGVESYTVGNGRITNYLRMQFVTTNAVSVGAIYQN